RPSRGVLRASEQENVAGPKYPTRLKPGHTSTQASARAPPRQIFIPTNECDSVSKMPSNAYVAPTRPVTSLNVFGDLSAASRHVILSAASLHVILSEAQRSEESRSGPLG